MAISISDYLETQWINHLFGGTPLASPVAVYVAVGTGATDTGMTGEQGAGVNGYNRKAITFNAAAGRAVSNQAVSFDQASGNWGTMTHWGVFDSDVEGAGNLLAYGTINGGTGTAVNTNDTATLGAGQVVITAGAGGLTDFAVHSLLNHTFRNVAYTQPATNVAMGTGYTDSAAGTEVSGGNYARVNVAAWTRAANNVNNTGAITFPAPLTADWAGGVPADQIVIYDATTNVLAYGATAGISPLTDDTVELPATTGFDFTITD